MPCFSSYELLLFSLRTTARSRFGVAILAQVAWARLGPGPVWARFGAMDAVLKKTGVEARLSSRYGLVGQRPVHHGRD